MGLYVDFTKFYYIYSNLDLELEICFKFDRKFLNRSTTQVRGFGPSTLIKIIQILGPE